MICFSLFILSLLPFTLGAAGLPCDDQRLLDRSPHLISNSKFLDSDRKEECSKVLLEDSKDKKPLDAKTEKIWWKALEEGNLAQVKETLRLFIVDVNQADNRGWTPLHIAADNAHTSTCNYLLKVGADVNQGDYNGWTALHIAAEKGHSVTCKFFVRVGADVKKMDEHGVPPLFVAAERGHTSICKWIVKYGKADINYKVREGFYEGTTPLYWAAANGHTATCQYLIGAGADVKKGDDSGWTALHIAVEKGRTATCTYLIECAGADVNQVTHDGQSPLDIAKKGDFQEIIALLRKKSFLVKNNFEKSGATKKGYAQIFHFS